MAQKGGNGLLPISWSSDNGSHLFVHSVDEGSGGSSSIGTYSRKSPRIRRVFGIPGSCAGVPYYTPASRESRTLGPAVRSRTPRGPGIRREPCYGMTLRNRSARGSPGPRTADWNGSPPATNAPLGPRTPGRCRYGADTADRAPRCDFGQDDLNVLGCHASSCLQRQAFTSIFIYETQPLEDTAVAGTIEDKVPCPYVDLPTRRPEMTGVPILPCGRRG